MNSRRKLVLLLSCILSFALVSLHAQKAKSAARSALVVTWQDKDNGQWYAIGPTQKTSVGCKTEDEPYEYAGGKKGESRSTLKETRGIYRIHVLNRQLETYHIDAREFLKGKGIVLGY